MHQWTRRYVSNMTSSVGKDIHSHILSGREVGGWRDNVAASCRTDRYICVRRRACASSACMVCLCAHTHANACMRGDGRGGGGRGGWGGRGCFHIDNGGGGGAAGDVGVNAGVQQLVYLRGALLRLHLPQVASHRCLHEAMRDVNNRKQFRMPEVDPDQCLDIVKTSSGVY